MQLNRLDPSRWLSFVATVLVFCVWGKPFIPAFADEHSVLSSATDKDSTGQPTVSIESDLYRLTFSPSRGGRCVSFIIKSTGREWVYDGPTAGMFQDHFGHQYYPGELLNAKYDYAVERDGDRAISLRLWTVATGQVEGGNVDNLTTGVKVEKSISLRAGDRAVRVRNSFVNPTPEGKNVGMWIQQCFCYGGDRLFDTYYVPSVEGIRVNGRDDTGQQPLIRVSDQYSYDFIYQPVDGWTAGRDRRTNEGGVFVMDYNYLKTLYNCSGSYTTEWWLDGIPLPGGKSWSTEYLVIPVDGFTGFTHASPRLIANVEARPDANRLRLVHQLAGATEPLGSLTISTRIYGIRSRKEETLPALSVTGVGLNPTSVEQTWEKVQTEPLVFRVHVAGAGWQEDYEYVYQGAFTAKGIEGASQIAEYEIPRAKKVKTFLKPDSWSRPHNAHRRALVVEGMFAKHYRIEEALRDVDAKCDVKTCDWGKFPPTYEELLGFDVLILANAPAGADYQNEMVADFVRHGGGLLTLGGMHTYGGGQWKETPLEGLVPFSIPSGFDLERLKSGATPKHNGNTPIQWAVEWPRDARFFWINEGAPRPESVVVMTVGGRPAWIIGQRDEGRVASGLVTCHGEPRPGQVEAWTTPAWLKLVSKTVAWVVGQYP